MTTVPLLTYSSAASWAWNGISTNSLVCELPTSKQLYTQDQISDDGGNKRKYPNGNLEIYAVCVRENTNTH